jgi:aspartyl-tRNA synthetase
MILTCYAYRENYGCRFYRAFQNGTTARAAGVDRVVIFVVRHDEAARDIAMNQQAVDLLMDEPPKATQKQLRELHIRLNVPNKEQVSMHA